MAPPGVEGFHHHLHYLNRSVAFGLEVEAAAGEQVLEAGAWPLEDVADVLDLRPVPAEHVGPLAGRPPVLSDPARALVDCLLVV